MKLVARTVKSIRLHYSLFGLRGLLRRVACTLPFTNKSFEAPIPISHERVVVRLGTTDVAAFEQVFVNREYGFELQHDPKLIVDAGANVGMSSVFFSICYPQAKIIAIEPDPSNYLILKENARRFSNIEPLNVALWSHDTSLSLSDSGAGEWGIRVEEVAVRRGLVVIARGLSEILTERNIEKVDILKVDIEGSEFELFSEPSAWIDKVAFICAELHDRFRPGCSKVFDAATSDFSIRWRQGELVCVAREGLGAVEK